MQTTVKKTIRNEDLPNDIDGTKISDDTVDGAKISGGAVNIDSLKVGSGGLAKTITGIESTSFFHFFTFSNPSPVDTTISTSNTTLPFANAKIGDDVSVTFVNPVTDEDDPKSAVTVKGWIETNGQVNIRATTYDYVYAANFSSTFIVTVIRYS